MALDYQNSRGVQVIPVLKSGLEYLEEVNRASLEAENTPDIYIVSNDSLEKANLSGLAAEVKDQDSVLTTDFFPQTALDAVSYQGQKMAYPLYFETSARPDNGLFSADGFGCGELSGTENGISALF